MTVAYYNENNPHAAQWLRNLIRDGHIAPGIVDDRSVTDVKPSELSGYTQCHFFAGIGVWSHALRLAGWPDDKPVWTGSCPCQPFSGAGKRLGAADDRHLWPTWSALIEERRPATIFGEQVASRDALEWWDAVSLDLENQDYAVAVADMCAAGVGAPHIRQRLYWVANGPGDIRHQGDFRASSQGIASGPGKCVEVDRLADSSSTGLPACERPQLPGTQRHDQGRATEQCGCALHWLDLTAGERYGPASVEPLSGWRECSTRPADGACPIGLAYADGRDARAKGLQRSREHGQQQENRGIGERTSTPDGFWRNADWLGCTDGRWRPVEPGTFPLAHGVAGRVGMLRAYGNAICAPLAAEFIKAVSDALHIR